MANLDIFWSFRSPYCYLALDRILAIDKHSSVDLHIRPVWPLAVRAPEFFKNAHSNHLDYHALDSRRVAEYYCIPYRRPVPDPIIQDMQTGTIADNQPYIYQLTRLGVAAVQKQRGLEFIDHVSRLLWDGTVNGWHENFHLSSAIQQAGLEPQQLYAEIKARPDAHDEIIDTNEKALNAAGHWGVPTFVFENEPFFGQDRIDALIWRMKQSGAYPCD